MSFWNRLKKGVRYIGKGIKEGASHVKNYAGKAREKIQHVRKIGKGIYDAVNATPIIGDYMRQKEKELMNKKFDVGGYKISGNDMKQGVDTVDKILHRTQRVSDQVGRSLDGDTEAMKSLYGQGKSGVDALARMRERRRNR